MEVDVNTVISPVIWGYASVVLITFLTAFSELISRYRHVGKLFQNKSSWTYIGINVFFGVVAFMLLKEYDISYPLVQDSDILNGLMAGFLSVAVIRSSFANIKKANSNITAGLGFVMQTLLDAADRSYDQQRSEDELGHMSRIMSGVTFDQVIKDLPVLCMRVMNNVPYEEQYKLGQEINKIKFEDTNDSTKLLILGFTLCKMTNLSLLEKAVGILKESISSDASNASREVNEKREKLRLLGQLMEEIRD